MSAAPVYPVREPGVRRELPPAPKRRRRTVRRRAPRRNFAQVVIAQVALFGFVCSVTFGFSSLTGHSLMEQQRREALRAGNRARVARSDLARLRSRLERLTTMRAVDDWAKVKGFVPAYAVANNDGATASEKPAVVAMATKKANTEVKLELSVEKVQRDGEIH